MKKLYLAWLALLHVQLAMGSKTDYHPLYEKYFLSAEVDKNGMQLSDEDAVFQARLLLEKDFPDGSDAQYLIGVLREIGFEDSKKGERSDFKENDIDGRSIVDLYYEYPPRSVSRISFRGWYIKTTVSNDGKIINIYVKTWVTGL